MGYKRICGEVLQLFVINDDYRSNEEWLIRYWKEI